MSIEVLSGAMEPLEGNSFPFSYILFYKYEQVAQNKCKAYGAPLQSSHPLIVTLFIMN